MAESLTEPNKLELLAEEREAGKAQRVFEAAQGVLDVAVSRLCLRAVAGLRGPEGEHDLLRLATAYRGAEWQPGRWHSEAVSVG